jgi:Flp pilus assembly protein TadD
MLQKSLEINELSDTVTNMAWLLATKDDPLQAETFIQDKLNKYPSLWKLWMDLAIAKYKIGKRDEALQAAKQAYSLSQNGETSYLYNQISMNQESGKTTGNPQAGSGPVDAEYKEVNPDK